MTILQEIKKHYELQTVTWKEKETLVDTDCGVKRIRIWSDLHLLNWHVRWRDEVGKNSLAVADRMIRTVDGACWVDLEGRYLTLHDYVEGRHERGGHEKRWGLLLGNMLQAGLDLQKEFGPITHADRYSFDACLAAIHKLSKDYNELVSVRNSLPEANKRLNLAMELKQASSQVPLPLLDSDTHMSNGAQIFNILFYRGSNGYPEEGYRPLRKFLTEWLKECGPYSLRKLLTCINEHFSLEREQGYLLLAEILTPWELQDCVDQLKNTELSHIVACVESFEQDWDFNRILLHCFTDWMDDKRKRVAL
ncbi:hypothetical protein [Fictibacillus terranigra]|uniref:Uncharacterized protein n=1 Tax=Fictibacillus terranigra TaxID=3058424 RepID=A0ABT8E481_9BACL|nr:hypothetical protein [Fictibacillus sp. CENA-BCM004]MDN4072717.1 hypothetical protein [Fictibacillus sp. CENA-BCM004]